MIPFYHGAMRHLFYTYVESGGSTRIKSGALLIDFVLLFLEGCLFVMMGNLVPVTIKLGWSAVFLLILDTIWGLLAWIALTGAQAQSTEKKWLKINIPTALAITAILKLSSSIFHNREIAIQVAILLVVTLRTITDYSLCWRFYFPDP